jgi:hypothetical protein
VFGETVVLAERIIRNADVAKVIAVEGKPALLTFEFEADGIRITRRIEDLVGLREQHDPRLPLLRHAYASTVHFSQGLTVDRAYIASVHAMSREAMYVAMTRHRHVAQLFVDTNRLRASDLTGLPHALLAVLSNRQRKRTEREAQLESKRQAFFKESLRPDGKANASDYLANLDLAPDDRPIKADADLSRFQQIKVDTLARMRLRSEAGFEEAARFEPLVQPNWKVVGTYLRRQIAKATEMIAVAIASRQSRSHTSGRFRLRSRPHPPAERDIASAFTKPPEMDELSDSDSYQRDPASPL